MKFFASEKDKLTPGLRTLNDFVAKFSSTYFLLVHVKNIELSIYEVKLKGSQGKFQSVKQFPCKDYS